MLDPPLAFGNRVAEWGRLGSQVGLDTAWIPQVSKTVLVKTWMQSFPQADTPLREMLLI